MALVAAAVVPHSPLLMPTIAKEHTARSERIRTALLEVGLELYAAQPDVVIVLTPHGLSPATIPTIEVSDVVTGDLRVFGDLTTTLKLAGGIALSHRLKEAAEDANIPLLLQTAGGLDYGVTVPWLSMWPEPMPWAVVPFAIPPQSMEQSVRIGEVLRECCQSQSTRIAILASGDTSRRSRDMSEAARRPTADERVMSEAIVQNNIGRLTELKTNDACLRHPLAVLLATLHGLPWRGHINAFDVPLTVGQLVAGFASA